MIKDSMQRVNILGWSVTVAIFVGVIFAVSSVSAARLESPSYQLDTNLGGSFSGAGNSSSYKMETIGGEAVIGNGTGGSYKLSQQPIDTSVAALEVSLPAPTTSLGSISSGVSESADFTINVDSSTNDYNLSIQQDHDLRTADTLSSIPAISGSTAIPIAWEEGQTVGLGYSLATAPLLDAKWENGTRFAAIPNAATVFYSGTSGLASLTARLRLDVAPQQAIGDYSNVVTISGVATP